MTPTDYGQRLASTRSTHSGGNAGYACPACGDIRTAVLDSRWRHKERAYGRRRVCACGNRWPTLEISALELERLREERNAFEGLSDKQVASARAFIAFLRTGGS